MSWRRGNAGNQGYAILRGQPRAWRTSHDRRKIRASRRESNGQWRRKNESHWLGLLGPSNHEKHDCSLGDYRPRSPLVWQSNQLRDLVLHLQMALVQKLATATSGYLARCRIAGSDKDELNQPSLTVDLPHGAADSACDGPPPERGLKLRKELRDLRARPIRDCMTFTGHGAPNDGEVTRRAVLVYRARGLAV